MSFVAPLALDPVPTKAHALRPPAAHSSRPLAILLAEDNAINRMLIETLVRREGHGICSVTNGRKAVDAAGLEPFDLILMDIRMPRYPSPQSGQR